MILIGIGLIIYLINTKFGDNSKPAINSSELVNQIVLELNQSQSKNISQMLEYMNSASSRQNRDISENQLKLEQRFSQMQINIQTTLNSGLEKTQNSIHDRLQNAILNLSELNKAELDKLHQSTSKSFELLSKANQDKLDQINLDVQKRLDANFAQHLKSFEEVTKNLGEMKATASRMIDSTSSIDKLNNIFSRTSSKAFGDFGEKYLESILSENLSPNSWQKQVTVPGSQDKIDFVIDMDGKKIGIDSKFPVTKFQDYLDAPVEIKKQALKVFFKGVMDMAQDVSKKYSKSGFLDHVLVYFPSDSMYTEVANDEDTLVALQKLKIAPVSPVTIFPLIVMIRTYQFKETVNQNAEQIIQGLGKIKDHILVFQDEFRKLGEKIRQAQQNYDTADRSLTVVQTTVKKLESVERIEQKEVLQSDTLI